MFLPHSIPLRTRRHVVIYIYIFYVELAYLHAMKQHIAFPTIEKMNNVIHGFYSKSSKRTSTLDEMMAEEGEPSFRTSKGVQTR